MKAPWKTIAFTLMMIGIAGVALNQIFGYEMVSYISWETDDLTGIRYMKYDFTSYIQNLSLSINRITDISLNLPTRQFDDNFINCLAVVLDYIIFIINILLWPLRLGAYITSNLLAILGVEDNAQNVKNWLVAFIRGMTYLEIPYV